MNNENARAELLCLIEEQELCRENQENVNKLYDKLVRCLFQEMDRYLPKYTGLKSGKKYRIKKPYWNEHLKSLWNEMCNAEKVFLNFRGVNHVKQFLGQKFRCASTVFNRELRRAERKYNRDLQDKIETVCTENPRQFWEYIKKLGPKTKSKILEEVYDQEGNVTNDLNYVLQKWKD